MKDKWDAFVLRIKGYRTLAVNLLIGSPMLLDALGAVDFTAYFGPKFGSIMSAILVVTNIYLRYITTTSVGKAK